MATINGDGKPNELEGTGKADEIFGRGGNDEIEGRKGADTIEGGKGDDEIDGDSGSDVIRGGAGADEITGDNGNDVLFGGKGDDVFKFESREGDDHIGSFAPGADRVEFDIDGLGFDDLNIRSNGDGDAVVTWGDPSGASITFDGLNPGALSQNDFLFDN